MGDLDLFFGDQRTGNGSPQQIFTLVNGIGTEHREDKIFDKLLLQIQDKDILRLDSKFQRFGSRWLHLFALPQIGGEGYHFAVVLILEPLKDNARIQAT